ncbi:MAG: hypothetical protein GY842_19830 [bacterium]|nr:hypothetical protein [bacterium]
MGSLRCLPELTVVEADEPSTVLERAGFLNSLAAQHSKTPGPSKILFVFKAKKSTIDAKNLSEVLVFFSRFADVDFARGADQAAFALQEALAKLLVLRTRSARAGLTPDPLGNLASVIAETAGLRAKSGRLSAQKVAAAFGSSVAGLAKLLGRSRQAVSKSPDAESIQVDLAPFTRIARLRTVLSDDDFRAWLNLPNEYLDARSPWAVIRSGNVEAVAELAEDMLSGSPA